MQFVQWMYPTVLFRVDSHRRIGLSIDDAPATTSGSTFAILKTLKTFNVKATFFVIGSHAASSPSLMQAIVDDGHEVGHHHWQDYRSISLNDEEFQRDMQRTTQVIGACRWFRPGGGLFSARCLALAQRAGLRTALGSVYPWDAHIQSSTHSSWFVCRNVNPGDIIVLHDRPWTPLALQSILAHCRANGWEVCSLSDLVQEAPADRA